MASSKSPAAPHLSTSSPTAAAAPSSRAQPASTAPSVTQTSAVAEPKASSANGNSTSSLPNGKSSSAQPAAGSARASSPKQSKPKKKKRHGFWASLKAALIPCAAPSSAHPIDEDPVINQPAVVSPAEREKDQPSPSVVSEKPAVAPTESHSADPTASTVTGTTAVPEQHRPAIALSVPVSAPVPVSPPTEPEEVIPPSPKPQLLSQEESEGMLSGSVQAPGSTGAPETETEGSLTDDEDAARDLEDQEAEDDEERLIMQGGAGIPIGPDGQPKPLLPPLAPSHAGRKCLVLDLDETLVHSSFKLIPQADYVVPVEIEWQWHNVYVIKRPGVDNFLKKMGELYEIVVFTASLSKYADPVLDKLDVHKVVSHRLFRESCYNHKGNYVKDLSQLGRPLTDTIILDNSPASYIFHPNNAVPVSSWFNDPHDTELTDLCPFLSDLRVVDDVRGVLDGGL
ncbi:hypothetical protein FS749_006962 [Ceratobasidium sp. UAMH 11750]|nr:hypothetical protein FS749_006962 [Ceratobasidium sp. UAMH 11750]